MAEKKFYAVRKGKKPGIYSTWDKCKKQVDGFSGAEYKGFGTLIEAETFLYNTEKQTKSFRINENEDNEIIVYVDGSYNDITKEVSYGMVTIHNGKERYFSGKVKEKDLAEMRNVAGEIKGAEAAMCYAIKNNYEKLVIYHDYEGISKWCTGEWKAKKKGTQDYKELFENVSKKLKIEFVKVQGHSGDKYNDIADMLAKKVIFGEEAKGQREECCGELKGNVYINRNLDELYEMLLNEGAILWESFKGGEIRSIGNQKRFEFFVDKKKAYLDIHQRRDGTTTFNPTGLNIEYSFLLKEAIEKCGVRNTSENKNYTIYLGEEWCRNVLEYLKQLPDVNVKDISDKNKEAFQFVSKIGDRLTLSLYDYKVMVQGKPLYLYHEFLSFISHAPQVTVNDVVDLTNTFNDTIGEASDTKAKMGELLPTAYNDGKIEETIWKLFSPSIILIEDEKKLDDYSACVFPALRALEGYLKLLLNVKGIVVDKSHTFGSVFRPERKGDETSNHVLMQKYKILINNSTFEQVLEEIYNYFRRNRHTIFHVDHVIIATRLIEEKQEAKDIFAQIVYLIENTYKRVESEL